MEKEAGEGPSPKNLDDIIQMHDILSILRLYNHL